MMENEELDELIKKYIYESPDGGTTVSRREIGDETNSKEWMSMEIDDDWEADVIMADNTYSLNLSDLTTTDDVYTSSVYTTSASPSSITIDPNPYANSPGLTVEVDGEERSVTDLFKTVDTIKKRMAILEPKKELLEKYELLQSLYEQYKTAEALLDGPDPEDEE